MKRALFVLLAGLAMTSLASAQTSPAVSKINKGEFAFGACNGTVKAGAKPGVFDFTPNITIVNTSAYQVDRYLVRMFFFNQKHENLHIATVLDRTGIHPATIPTGRWSAGKWPQDTTGVACQILALRLVGDPARYVFHR
jgi:hypothetical protein